MRIFRTTVFLIIFLTIIAWINHSRFETDSVRFTPERDPAILAPDDNTMTDISTAEVDVPKARASFEYYDMESGVQVPWKYDRRFKNPCWYENGTLYCLPYFFIIGIMKCGTTSLYMYLMHHPEVVKGRYKEPQFFNFKSHLNQISDRRNIYTYIDMFSDVATKIEQDYKNRAAGTSASKLICCDASQTYLNRWKPGNDGLEEPKYVVLDYIQRMLPKAKMIMVLRNPVDRLYSDYYMSIRRDNDTAERIAGPDHFHAVVEQAVKDYERCLGSHSSRFCVYNEKPVRKFPFRFGLRLSSGVYHVYMEEMLRLFPRQQILLLKTNTIDTRHELTRVFNFLGLKIPESDHEWDRINNGDPFNVRKSTYKSKGPMLNVTRKLLYEFYRPLNGRMVDITGNKEFAFEMSD